MVNLLITLAGDDNDERHLQSLHDWLLSDDELRRLGARVNATPKAPADVEHMGSILDVLTVALGAGGAGAVLASSLRVWLTQLRTDVSVRIVRGDESIEIDARRVRDAERLVNDMNKLVEGRGNHPGIES